MKLACHKLCQSICRVADWYGTYRMGIFILYPFNLIYIIIYIFKFIFIYSLSLSIKINLVISS
jgi:hypothetical protein